MVAVIVSNLVFSTIVMPAWIMYIVPHTIELKDDELHVKDYDDHDSIIIESPSAPHESVDLSLHGSGSPALTSGSVNTDDSTCLGPSGDASSHGSGSIDTSCSAMTSGSVNASK